MLIGFGYLYKPLCRIRSHRLGSSRQFHDWPSKKKRTADFAFAFDIDGVLLRSADPIPGAHESLSYLQSQKIPFVLLTNGGGSRESDRVKMLSELLRVPLDTSQLVQGHTPIANLHQYKDAGKTVLVVGGSEDQCRHVAIEYGFKSVVLPADIMVQHPAIWPISTHLLDYYRTFTRPLPKPILLNKPDESLKIDAIFVFNDPRDWGLDATIILDLLLSNNGIMGTVSTKNNTQGLPNGGYLQDNQPALYFCNPDTWWAAKYHLPRLGQGAFREALQGIWASVTGGEKKGVQLKKTLIGKPFQLTYEFAEQVLLRAHKNAVGPNDSSLHRVYMIGDNPESDIRGGNDFKSPDKISWSTILVKTGVFTKEPPAYTPTEIFRDVREAVRWALAREKWSNEL